MPDALRGTGAGRALVERLVVDAWTDGVKIVPLCPFMNRERAGHPDGADVFRARLVQSVSYPAALKKL
jgi:predicted GNAT family acetyltransferase